MLRLADTVRIYSKSRVLTRHKMGDPVTLREDHIAIVGIAARLPGAASADEFWTNLAEGVESVKWLEDDQLRAMGVEERVLSSDNYVRASYSADALDEFDPGFFGMTQREAEIKDPQHRLFLELAHTALEDAGYDHRRMTRRVGVFGGTANSGYMHDYVFANAGVLKATGGMSVSVGNYPDYLAPTVAYKLGFTGPSLSVYTACSTSLVAVHLAAQSLRNGECDVALAGAAQVDMPIGSGYMHAEGSIHSADGHVRPFDAQASGTVFSNGGGVVVLKLLANALRDGDTVRAVIRGSAVNNDGSDRAGFTAPGSHGQTELILDAMADAEVGPHTIDYLEAHGTGTVVGDPIELNAITDAYRQSTAERGYCALASLKGNVGHLGPASGIASLIKVAYALEHEIIPASINCGTVNPALDLDASPFRLQQETIPWPVGSHPRRAAVSSFGIGGTNAHLVLEAAPVPEMTVTNTPGHFHILPLSGRSQPALDALTDATATHLAADRARLAGAAFTLQEGRGQHGFRRAVVVESLDEAVLALRTDESGRPVSAVDGTASVAFLFPGQGAQYPSMGRGLYLSQPVYRAALDRCAAVVDLAAGVDLLALLHADQSDESAAALLGETRITQPATFAVNWSLAQLWRSWGVEPDAMLGHSVGEYVAACLAGVLDVDDALRLLVRRGDLMQALPRGKMVALPLDAEVVRPLLDEAALKGRVQLAVSNSPSASVV
ncbi:MAG: hypothetical protein QOE58_2380, partial [Actinomycetota bacterium]|nr:hypothetical protein [Actinomycetota bacterium]